MDTPVRPVVMGVAGGSGSGKSTVVREVRRVVGRKTVSVIHHDAYYRDLSHLTFEERAEVNFDHPDSLETELLVAHVEQLMEGSAVDLPTYDFSTHMRRPQTRHLAPTPVVVIDGILALADERLRALMDLKVFVETDEQARLRRRIRRDMRDRGRSLASVRSQFDRTVRPMHDHFVVPSKEHADLVIAKGGFNREGVARVVSQLKSLLDSAEQT
jgi:uridine kinase